MPSFCRVAIDNFAVIFLWRSLAVNLSCDLFHPLIPDIGCKLNLIWTTCVKSDQPELSTQCVGSPG